MYDLYLFSGSAEHGTRKHLLTFETLLDEELRTMLETTPLATSEEFLIEYEEADGTICTISLVALAS